MPRCALLSLQLGLDDGVIDCSSGEAIYGRVLEYKIR